MAFTKMPTTRPGTESALDLASSNQEASVLILNDLGPLINIVEFLKACAATPDLVTEDKVAEIGRTVGKVFAVVHSPDVVEKVKAQPATADKLTHSLTKTVVLLAAVEPIHERLASLPNAEQLYARVLKDYQDPVYNYRQCLSLGDFTHASILMQPPAPGSDLTPVIVDWEFAQLNGRGVNGDMAQFLANLHLELIAAPNDSTLHGLLWRFTSELCSAYRDDAALAFKKQADDDIAQLMRSAFILHGREIINQAHDLQCSHPRFRDMVNVGVWYIERAGDDIDAFVREDNWRELKEEDSLIIQSMFTAL